MEGEDHEVKSLLVGMNMVYLSLPKCVVDSFARLTACLWSDRRCKLTAAHGQNPACVSINVQYVCLYRVLVWQPNAISQKIFSKSVTRSGFPDSWDIWEPKKYKRASQIVHRDRSAAMDVVIAFVLGLGLFL